nr:MAG TPA: hypothetical protein [Caudoviricetes sp.]
MLKIGKLINVVSNMSTTYPCLNRSIKLPIVPAIINDKPISIGIFLRYCQIK